MNTKDLRVFGIPWHTAHQYELAKLFKSYDFLINYYREWGTSSRPRPENSKDVMIFNPNDYDLAILHVDQQCIDPKNNKGKLFREAKALTEGMKRVIINHMTPFDDKLEFDDVVNGMRELVGDIPMVVNSRQAATQWGWGTPIIHGLDVSDWWDLPKEPRVVTSLSTGGMAKAYRRELLHVTMEILKEDDIELVWIQSTHKCKSWDEYREYLGRSLIYFNPTWQSPMPRSRTEAMLSGCCIVSTRHHDWENYIENGVNGFIIPDNPQSAARIIKELLTTRVKEAREIGERGRQTAIKEFSQERWAADWEKFLTTEVFK